MPKTALYADKLYDNDQAFLGRVANRIINEVRGINRMTYDVTSKPLSSSVSNGTPETRRRCREATGAIRCVAGGANPA